ncbi:MAG: hypothetical protein L3J35_09815 [Bacteroidales bacterium]|nr:hypothetical protein [Bacteroidales bacterium]
MRYFTWKKIYETGISKIDAQHKKLFSLVNSFYSELFSDSFTPDSKTIYCILKKLNCYYKYHYNYERAVYSEEIILKYFDKENLLAEKINNLICTKKDADIIAFYGFAEYLRKWLVRHVLILNNKFFKEDINKKAYKISCN